VLMQLLSLSFFLFHPQQISALRVHDQAKPRDRDQTGLCTENVLRLIFVENELDTFCPIFCNIYVNC
jgi:hypothetical protein